jgi:hypothetical protein
MRRWRTIGSKNAWTVFIAMKNHTTEIPTTPESGQYTQPMNPTRSGGPALTLIERGKLEALRNEFVVHLCGVRHVGREKGKEERGTEKEQERQIRIIRIRIIQEADVNSNQILQHPVDM